jgi:hypothetical protein
VSGIVGSPSRALTCWRVRIFRRIRDGEKGVLRGGEGARKSWTVDFTAVAISARDV